MEFNLPNQQDIPGVDTRPGPLRDWLEGLPYTEIIRSTRRIIERLHDVNDQQRLPPAHRLELMDAFLHAYMRLHEWLSESPQIEAYQNLKFLTRQMAVGYKIVVRDMIDAQQRWNRPKHLLTAVEQASRFLVLELVCDFQAYNPVDRHTWHEINGLLRIAGDKASERFCHTDLGHRLATGSTGDIFVQAALLRLGDPYHLPPGSVWEAFGYLGKHAGNVPLTNYAIGEPKPGIFVLRPDSEPALVTDVTESIAGSYWLDAREAISTMQGHVDQLLSSARPTSLGMSDKLTSSDAAQIIAKLYTQWLHPANRRAPRFSSAQTVYLVAGLPACWQSLNQGHAFEAKSYGSVNDNNYVDVAAANLFQGHSFSRRYETVLATTRNRSAGGVSLNLPAREAARLSVGQLVAINNDDGPVHGSTAWVIGIIRWLTVEGDSSADIGIQYVGRQVKTGAVRPFEGGSGEFQPALQTELHHAGQVLETLIAPRGTYRHRRLLELRLGHESLHARIDRLIETGATYDRFSYVFDQSDDTDQ